MKLDIEMFNEKQFLETRKEAILKVFESEEFLKNPEGFYLRPFPKKLQNDKDFLIECLKKSNYSYKVYSQASDKVINNKEYALLLSSKVDLPIISYEMQKDFDVINASINHHLEVLESGKGSLLNFNQLAEKLSDLKDFYGLGSLNDDTIERVEAVSNKEFIEGAENLDYVKNFIEKAKTYKFMIRKGRGSYEEGKSRVLEEIAEKFRVPVVSVELDDTYSFGNLNDKLFEDIKKVINDNYSLETFDDILKDIDNCQYNISGYKCISETNLELLKEISDSDKITIKFKKNLDKVLEDIEVAKNTSLLKIDDDVEKVAASEKEEKVKEVSNKDLEGPWGYNRTETLKKISEELDVPLMEL